MNSDFSKIPDFSLAFYRLRHDAARRFAGQPNLLSKFSAQTKRTHLTRTEINSAIEKYKRKSDSSLKLDVDSMKKNYWWITNTAPSKGGTLTVIAKINGIETLVLVFQAENNIRQEFFEEPVVTEEGEQSRYEWLIETMLNKDLPVVSFNLE